MNVRYSAYPYSFLLVMIMILMFPSLLAVSANQEVEVSIHYKPLAGDLNDWDLWVWTDGDGQAYAFNDEDEYGKVANFTLPSNTKKVNYIVRLPDWSKRDCQQERTIEVINQRAQVWLTGGSCAVSTSGPPVLDTLPDAGDGSRELNLPGAIAVVITCIWVVASIWRKNKMK